MTSSQLTITPSIERTPNLNPEIVKLIVEGLGLILTPEKETNPGTFAPIDLLDYIYAILHSPAYREKYKEFLKIDFPRVPYPAPPGLPEGEEKNRYIERFWKLVDLGGELRQLHLLESPTVDQYITRYPKTGDNKVGKLRYVRTSPDPSKGGEEMQDNLQGMDTKVGKLRYVRTSPDPSKGGEEMQDNLKGGDTKVGKLRYVRTSPDPSKGGEEIQDNLKGGEEIQDNLKGGEEIGTENDEVEGNSLISDPGWLTADQRLYRYVKEIREQLKANPTKAEKVMWELLRNRKTGHKIRRQHVMGSFIVDFVCLQAKTVIEIDGEIHLQQKEYDEARTRFLNEMGYKVIRFTNEEVFADSAQVVTQIKEKLDDNFAALSSSEPVQVPPPSEGLGEVRLGEVGRVYINETQYFEGVPEVAWNFYIGGYQPAQKWLKDRKDRVLEFEDILHYQKIIVALTETARLMKLVDEVGVE